VNPTQERIRYYTELLKILWVTLIADIGGVASLALGPSEQEEKAMLEPIALIVSFSLPLLFCIIVGISVWRAVWQQGSKS